MDAAEGVVTLRGREVYVREGDLILLHDRGIVSWLIGLFNAQWSHVATVVVHEKRLVAFSVYQKPDGLVMELLERYDSDFFSRLAIVRPYVRRSALQTMRLREAVQGIMRAHAANPRDAYDHGVAECAHALFKMRPASEDRYICSELAARLARAAGAWPEHRSVSVKIDDLAWLVGRTEVVF